MKSDTCDTKNVGDKERKKKTGKAKKVLEKQQEYLLLHFLNLPFYLIDLIQVHLQYPSLFCHITLQHHHYQSHHCHDQHHQPHHSTVNNTTNIIVATTIINTITLPTTICMNNTHDLP